MGITVHTFGWVGLGGTARREVRGECLDGCPDGLYERCFYFYCHGDVLKFLHVGGVSTSILQIIFSAFRDPTLDILIDTEYVVAAIGVGFNGYPLLIVTLDKPEPG